MLIPALGRQRQVELCVMRPACSTDSGQPRIYKENPLEKSLAWAGCLVSLSDHSSPPSKHWDYQVKHCFKDCYVCACLSRCMSTINCRYLQRLEERDVLELRL